MWAAVRENGDFFTFVDHVKTNKHVFEFLRSYFWPHLSTIVKNIMKNKILQLFMDGADRTYTEVNVRRKIYQKYKFIKHTDGIY